MLEMIQLIAESKLFILLSMKAWFQTLPRHEIESREEENKRFKDCNVQKAWLIENPRMLYTVEERI